MQIVLVQGARAARVRPAVTWVYYQLPTNSGFIIYQQWLLYNLGQWDFQGPLIMGPLYGKRDPNPTPIFESLKIWEAYHKGVPCPWGSLGKSPLTWELNHLTMTPMAISTT